MLQVTNYPEGKTSFFYGADKLQKDKGFTLIELLIVVAIIGLISSTIMVGLKGFRAIGRDARRITDLKETQNALELYYLKNNKYPAISGADSWNSLRTSLIGGGIGISTIPNDPLYVSDGSKRYEYGISSDSQSYVLKATLEDPNNSALNDDTDNTLYGIDCDGPSYCVQF